MTTVRAGVLELTRELPRPPVAYIVRGPAGDVEVTGADIESDTEWVRARLAAWGLSPGSRALLSCSGHEGAWFLPVIEALRRSRVPYGITETFGQDWRRCLAFQRELTPDAVLALSADTVRALAGHADLARLFGSTRVVSGRPDAVAQLRAAGVAAGVLGPLGPALLVACPATPGAHVNGARWVVRTERSRVSLSAIDGRINGLDTGTAGSVTAGRCACGSDDPRIVLAG